MDSIWEAAINQGDADTVRALLYRGADVNGRDRGLHGCLLSAYCVEKLPDVTSQTK
jgi:ankyrin repeat protein